MKNLIIFLVLAFGGLFLPSISFQEKQLCDSSGSCDETELSIKLGKSMGSYMIKYFQNTSGLIQQNQQDIQELDTISR